MRPGAKYRRESRGFDPGFLASPDCHDLPPSTWVRQECPLCVAKECHVATPVWGAGQRRHLFGELGEAVAERVALAAAFVTALFSTALFSASGVARGAAALGEPGAHGLDRAGLALESVRPVACLLYTSPSPRD